MTCNRCVLWAPWPWRWLIEALPFNGAFFAYEGGYWPALWHWMRG